jgi:hypothetical protein
MYLGTKGQISAVEPDQARKKEKLVQGQIDVEHGDIVVVRTYETEMDVGLKPQGFGFCESRRRAFDLFSSVVVCVARQIYPPSSPAREGTGLPLTSFKRKEPELIPREWPQAAVPSIDKSRTTIEARKPEAALEEQGWNIGNIPIWSHKGDAPLTSSV